MDPSFFPPPLPPIAPGAPLHLRRRAHVATAATPAIRSAAASNARRVFACAPHSPQSACESVRWFPPAHRRLYFLTPPCAPPVDATPPAASLETASRSTVAPAGPRPRDPIYSARKCRRSPSTRLSCSGYRRPSPAPTSPPRNPQAARYQFHPAPRPPFRSALAVSPPHPAAKPPPR